MGRVITLPSPEDLSGLAPPQLERALVDAERHRRMIEAVLIDVLDEADRRRVWATDGHVSVRGWASALTGVSHAENRRRLQVMRALRDLDLVRARLRVGEVGVDQVRELAAAHANPRARTHLPTSEQMLLGHACSLPFEDFLVVLRRWALLADPDGAARDRDRSHERRNAYVAQLGDELHIAAHGGTAQGLAVAEIFERFCDAEFRIDAEEVRVRLGDQASSSAMSRTAAQRRFDALHAIFLAAVSVAPGSRAPEPIVNVVVDQATFEQHLAHAGGGPRPQIDPLSVAERRCETSAGVVLDPRDVVAAALVGRVRRVVMNSAGVVIDLGRTQRLFTGGARDAVGLQDRRCLWPGCGRSRRQSQIDHSIDWAKLGLTAPHNGGLFCGRHNRWKSRGYRVFRDSDGCWHLLRPDGTELDEPRAA